MLIRHTAAHHRLRSRLIIGAAAATTLLTVAACGSGGSGGSSASGSSDPGVSAKTITLGYIGDVTGPLSTLTGDALKGAQARIDLQNDQGGIAGRKIVLDAQDTQSSPTNLVTNARTLVTQDHVFSVIEQSCVFAGAAPYLTQQNVPVVSGLSCDGYEWVNHANTNLIDAGGAAPANASAAYQASVLKEAGVTKLATVSAGGFAAGIANEEAIANAAKAAGIKVVYVNESETSPATGLSSVAVAIQHAGANGVSVNLPHNADNLALFAALKAQGANVVEYSPMGYTPGFLSDASNRAALQGFVTTFPWAPLFLGTPATKTFAAAIKKYEPSIGDPGVAAYTGWVGADAMIAGLLAAGNDLTRANVLAKLHGMADYTAGGLNAGPVDLSVAKEGSYEAASAGNCGYALKVVGGQYQMFSNKPVCGPPSAG